MVDQEPRMLLDFELSYESDPHVSGSLREVAGTPVRYIYDV